MIHNLENEQWYSIKDYEGIYEISNLGRVKVLYREWYSGMNNCIVKKKPEHIILQRLRKGYYSVVLSKSGSQTTYSVHRLLALSCIKNPENKPEINHKNGIKTDNSIENLEWCTGSENQIHAIQMGLKVSQKRGEHSQARKIKCDTLDMIFDCIKDCADTLNVDKTNIWKVCNNYLTHAKGFSFRYI